LYLFSWALADRSARLERLIVVTDELDDLRMV
jgi:hypothetical protein